MYFTICDLMKKFGQTGSVCVVKHPTRQTPKRVQRQFERASENENDLFTCVFDNLYFVVGYFAQWLGFEDV